MQHFIKVKRKIKADCLVAIMLDRHTNKFCFVNLTSNHVCSCRFDTYEDAMDDLKNRDDVVSYKIV